MSKTINEQIKGLKDNDTTLNNNISSLKSEVSTLNSDVTTLKATSLYESTSGTQSNITLNSNVGNYNEIEINYLLKTSAEGSLKGSTGRIKLEDTTTKVNISIIRPVISYATMQIVSEIVSVSGTSLTRGTQRYFSFSSDGSISAGTDVVLYITSVIGYKA